MITLNRTPTQGSISPFLTHKGSWEQETLYTPGNFRLFMNPEWTCWWTHSHTDLPPARVSIFNSVPREGPKEDGCLNPVSTQFSRQLALCSSLPFLGPSFTLSSYSRAHALARLVLRRLLGKSLKSIWQNHSWQDRERVENHRNREKHYRPGLSRGCSSLRVGYGLVWALWGTSSALVGCLSPLPLVRMNSSGILNFLKGTLSHLGLTRSSPPSLCRKEGTLRWAIHVFLSYKAKGIKFSFSS